MSCVTRQHFFSVSAAVICICLCSMLYYASQLREEAAAYATKAPPGKVNSESEQCSYMGDIASGTITPLQNQRTFVIAAYYDNREGRNIRVLAIVHHQEVKELYCWFHCYSQHGYVSIKKATIDIHSDRFEYPYGTADVLCLEPENCNPKYLSIHWSPEGESDKLPVFEIKNRNPESFSANFTVCISTLFGNYNNVLQVIQTIEMYKLLGAQKVMIYRNNCSTLLEHILKYYIAQGTVEVVPWPIHEYLNTSQAWHHSQDPKDIGYYGQLATLNDCVYRNMYRSKYVILNDLDQIVLPFKHHNWQSMMDSLQSQHPNTGIFLFENHVFPNTEFTSTEMFNMTSWKAVPGEDILQHVRREPDRKTVFNARKMIVNPRKVIQTSVHSVLKAYGKSLQVSMDIAIVYHCRSPLQAALPKASLINDTAIWRYNVSLIRNVNEVLTNTQQITVD